MTFTETLAIQPVGPFDFDLTAQIFQRGDEKIRTFQGGVFTQVINVNNKLALVSLTSTGTVSQPQIAVEVKSNHPFTSLDKCSVLEMVSYVFNLNLNLCNFYQAIKNDATMKRITQQLYGLRNPTTPKVFESLVDSIIEQQISILVAIVLEEKLTKKFGERLELDGKSYFAFPTPHSLARRSVEEIQNIGLSRRKAEYVLGVANEIVSGKLNLEVMRNYSSAEKIISELDAIRGIGAWTAELTMLRGMQRLEAFPADDLGLRRVISKYYCDGKPIKSAEARNIAEAWGNWKGLAAFYLIVAEVKDITA